MGESQRNHSGKVLDEKHQHGVSAVQEPPMTGLPNSNCLLCRKSHGLSGESLQARCRARSLFAYHLTRWKTVFWAAGKEPALGVREARTLKDENVKLAETNQEHIFRPSDAIS
jgi:hypothetical protein